MVLSLQCGFSKHVIAFITKAPAVRPILAYLNEPTSPWRIAPVRGPAPREIDHAGLGEFDPQVQPALTVPDWEFDQRILC